MTGRLSKSAKQPFASILNNIVNKPQGIVQVVFSGVKLASSPLNIVGTFQSA
jgi:hypothetical protein